MSESEESPKKSKAERMGGGDEGALTRAELRGYIAKEAGKRTNWQTPFDKETLNAIYRYLTGEYYVPRSAVHAPNHPRFVTVNDVRYAIAEEVGIIQDEDDLWTTEAGNMPQAFRRDELITIRAEMLQRGSQMPTPDRPGADE